MFENAYENKERAAAYAQLRFPGTYHLAYRDLPEIFRRHVQGADAMDFGCGAGRSTRFLRDSGFRAIGVDIAAEMLAKAREINPDGDYRLIPDGDLRLEGNPMFDLVFCAFPFDNIQNERKGPILKQITRILKKGGKVVIVGSTPDIYLHEWASFSTKDFPENRSARDGETVRTINVSTRDQFPVDDILCSDRTYREIYRNSGLQVVEKITPLGHPEEPIAWVNETCIAPWVIYVCTAITEPS